MKVNYFPLICKYKITIYYQLTKDNKQLSSVHTLPLFYIHHTIFSSIWQIFYIISAIFHNTS